MKLRNPAKARLHGFHLKKRRRRNPLPIVAACGLVLGAVIGIKLSNVGPAQLPATVPISDVAEMSAPFTLCHTGGGTNCVVDGDTFWMAGQNIRVSDIDAPETHPPRCRFEAQLGNRATKRLQELLNQGPIQLEGGDRDVDIHGRLLRVVRRGGQSLGQKLVDEGLARPWTGHRQPWC
ncbi:MAG TPA: thermonuclease family protein [Rhizomicrobium sp.]|nr:thermonuclease family protein [Rhizomicrobium sp.]